MTKSFKEYAQERKANFSQEGKDAYEVFSSAFSIGNMVSAARRVRDLTQRELAQVSGVQQADISRIERGLLAPNTITFLRLLEAMDYSFGASPKPVKTHKKAPPRKKKDLVSA